MNFFLTSLFTLWTLYYIYEPKNERLPFCLFYRFDYSDFEALNPYQLPWLSNYLWKKSLNLKPLIKQIILKKIAIRYYGKHIHRLTFNLIFVLFFSRFYSLLLKEEMKNWLFTNHCIDLTHIVLHFIFTSIICNSKHKQKDQTKSNKNVK